MKSKLIVLAAASLVSASALAFGNNSKPNVMDRFKAKTAKMEDVKVDVNDVSYSFGYMMGTNMKKQKMSLNTDQFVVGLKDAIAGKDGKFDRDKMMKMLMAYQRQARQKMMDERQKQAEENKKAGETFLDKNKAKDGVVSLPSGLQYRVLNKGSGKKPTLADKVKVTYTGRLINGDEFAKSDDSSKPAEFTLKQVIPAWKEALQLMPIGAKWELYVPAKLGYGARGTSGKIGPNQALIFDIELLSIEKGQEKKAEAKTNKSSALAPKHDLNQKPAKY